MKRTHALRLPGAASLPGPGGHTLEPTVIAAGLRARHRRWRGAPAALRGGCAALLWALASAGIQASPCTAEAAARRSPAPGAEAAQPVSTWVRRTGTLVTVDACAVPRQALVAQLAQATGTQLMGDVAVLARTPVVKLRWQGRDAIALWAGLLDGHANFAAQCQGLSCRVWLSAAQARGQAHANGATTAPHDDVVPRSPHRAPQSDPPGLFPAE